MKVGSYPRVGYSLLSSDYNKTQHKAGKQSKISAILFFVSSVIIHVISCRQFTAKICLAIVTDIISSITGELLSPNPFLSSSTRFRSPPRGKRYMEKKLEEEKEESRKELEREKKRMKHAEDLKLKVIAERSRKREMETVMNDKRRERTERMLMEREDFEFQMREEKMKIEALLDKQRLKADIIAFQNKKKLEKEREEMVRT